MLILVASVSAIVVALFLARRLAQRTRARNAKIGGRNAIEEDLFIQVGGIEQWIQIRGEDRANPPLLLLHGGPGVSYVPFGPCFRDWERDFTVVQWDQRGAGKTFGRNGPGGEDLTVDRMVEDGLEVSEYLGRRFGGPIVLFAHSWGSILGVRMVSRRPDIFRLYVGAGQVASMEKGELASFDLLKERLETSGNAKGLKALIDVGPPPYTEIKKWIVKQRLIVQTDPPPKNGALPDMLTASLLTPGYSIKDSLDWMRAFMSSTERLFPQMMGLDSILDAPRLGVPTVFVQGERDLQVPLESLRPYFEAVECDAKELIVLEGEGHTALLSSPEVFGDILRSRIVAGQNLSVTVQP